MSHFRSCWQLSSTAFCVCLNLLLTKCSRPDALNTKVRDLSTLQIQNSKQLSTKYLLFLTCHHQDTWAKRNYFRLSSLLRLSVNKATWTNCYHGCLLGKGKEKESRFPLHWQAFQEFVLGPSHDKEFWPLFIRARFKLVYCRTYETSHLYTVYRGISQRNMRRKEMELLAVGHLKGQPWIYAMGIPWWKSADKSSTDLGRLLYRGNRAPSHSVWNWSGQCLRMAQERVTLT